VKAGKGGSEGERSENRCAWRHVSQRGGAAMVVSRGCCSVLTRSGGEGAEAWHSGGGEVKSFNHLNVDGGRWW